MRKIAAILAITFLNQFISPNLTMALTSGPSQPEVQSFEPVGTSDMVDVFSGDFNYNIPLLDVGGYPINIAYHGGIGMDQEASWVGLGWNLNPGVINRNMRGIPDDFKGTDKIKKETHVKPNVTVGAGFGGTLEAFGILKKGKSGASLGVNFGITNNNYRGWSYDLSFQPEINTGKYFQGEMTFGFNSAEGIDVDGNLSMPFGGQKKVEKDWIGQQGGSFSVGSGINSRGGMKALSLGMNVYVKGYNPGTGRATDLKYGGSTNWNFGTQTYTTKITGSQRQFGFSFKGKSGTEIFGLHPNIAVNGFFSTTQANSETTLPAYGYMYEDYKKDEKFPNQVLLDFNRENDNGLNDKSVNLPLTNHTFDIYGVSGQGVGGSYRTYRSDIGILHDHSVEYGSFSGSGGIEAGVGNLAHTGGNISGTYTKTNYGLWEEGNGLNGKFGFVKQTERGNVTYEPFYFKPAGEMAVIDEVFFNNIKGNTPIQAELSPIIGTASGILVAKGSKTALLGSIPNTRYLPGSTPVANTKTKRDVRNKPMSVFTNNESSLCFEQHIFSVPLNSRYTQEKINRVNLDLSGRQPHHVREVVITNQDGSRYVYGIPAYNNLQIEKTFNISKKDNSHLPTNVCINGQALYTPGQDSRDNRNGEDEYYGSTEVPAYAHSYLLTSVVSPDYVDVKNDGITDDDLGTAVKFNYTRVHENFRWRTPYNTNTVNYQEGMKTKRTDDKGSYVYGEKEIWHMHSIESKNQVAIFVISQREDALGVTGMHGGKDLSQRSYKLDRIELFNKQDLINHPTTAEPIKIVYFEYDYSLCPNVENNSGSSLPGNENHGKLTLKKIYFSYGRSNKGKFSPYKFKYADFNPSYNLKGSDMWGSYLPSPTGASCNYDSPALNSEFPYTPQTKTTADQYAGAWNLTEVFLPSGGSIKVQYESDDYAYVQNKKAMQMLKLEGFGKIDNSGNLDAPVPRRNFLHRNKNGEGLHQDALLFKLPQTINGGSAQANKEKLFKDYLDGIKDLQITVFVDIDGKKANNYEYVKCYVEPDLAQGYGVTDNGATGWIALKKVSFGDKRGNSTDKVNPVSRAVWNHIRLNCDYLVNPQQHIDGSNDPTKNKGQILSMFAIHRDLIALFAGYNKNLFLRGFGSEIRPERSWVRLNCPTQIKFGGGHRVKKILINDNWSELGSGNNGATNTEYGQEYDYSTVENGKTISSGVASYEPQFSEENPFKEPKPVSVDNKLVPYEYLLQEEPVGESFFPGAGVGYSIVTVKNIGRANVKRTGTGKEVSEFYTAKDFPVIVEETDIRIEKQEPPKIFQLFKISTEKTISASQGYVIELNDMHGKPKKKFSYREGASTPYAGTEYVYKAKQGDASKLDNTVPVITSNGQISQKLIGIDYDFSQDMNEYKTVTTSGGAEVNLDNMYVILAVLTVPTIYPSYKRNKVKVRTSVTTKIINRYAVLEKTIAYQEGASIETQNRLWDAQTGEVVLSSVHNEFKDNIYNFNYPAHFAYDGMGQSYLNDGLILYNAHITQSNIVLPGGLNPKNYLVPGDEVVVYSGSQITPTNSMRAWVYDGNDNVLNLIDAEGYPFVRNAGDKRIRNIKVIRSGRRNLASTSIGSITTLSNPISGSSLSFNIVLNAEVAEFSDNWQTHLDYIAKRDCGENFTDTGQELINMIKYLAQNEKLHKNFYITNFKQGGGNSVTDDIEKFISGSWQYYGNTDNVSKTYITDTCEKYRIILSLKGNQYLTMKDNSTYYSTSPVNIYEVKYNNEHYYQVFYSSTSNTWTPSWLGTSKLYGKFGLAIGTVKLENIAPNIIEIHFNDACVLKIESDKPFNSISDLFDIIALDKHNLSGKAIIKGSNCETDTAEVNINVPCFNVSNCEYECRNLFVEGPVNPYKTNMRGVWRPKRTLKYLENRNYQNATVNTKSDGVYSSFSPYWTYNTTTQKYEADNSNQKWVWSAEVSKYSPFGPELETKDALGKYSSALYGYNYTHPVAVASNSRYQQIAFDGFEDYNYMNTFMVNLCPNNHFHFRDAIGMGICAIDPNEAHSGKNSLKVNANQAADFTRQLTDISVTPYSSYSEDVIRIGKEADNLGYFAPTPGNYVLGAWVKSNSKQGDTTITSSMIKITLTDASSTSTVLTFSAKGNIIEGWQRIEDVFEIPVGTKYFKLELISGEQEAWFDDIRLHPKDGNMATYVYDNRTLRLMAELDANNYATFYEYSLEGELVRVKKETIKGVQTLKEVKASSVKKPHNGIFNP